MVCDIVYIIWSIMFDMKILEFFLLVFNINMLLVVYIIVWIDNCFWFIDFVYIFLDFLVVIFRGFIV